MLFFKYVDFILLLCVHYKEIKSYGKRGRTCFILYPFISKKERNLYLNTIFLAKPTTNFDVIELYKLL
jgi:hypothetical protein